MLGLAHSLFEALVQVGQNGEEGQMGQATPKHCRTNERETQLSDSILHPCTAACTAGALADISAALLPATHPPQLSACPPSTWQPQSHRAGGSLELLPAAPVLVEFAATAAAACCRLCMAAASAAAAAAALRVMPHLPTILL
jgi:hypothetical protein